MPSNFSTRFAAVCVVAGQRHNGEPVTRIASDGTRDGFTAIADTFPEEWNEFDKCWEQRGFVEVASTVTVARSDKWEVKAKEFKVEKLGDDRHGMRRIDLIRQVKTGARP